MQKGLLKTKVKEETENTLMAKHLKRQKAK